MFCPHLYIHIYQSCLICPVQPPFVEKKSKGPISYTSLPSSPEEWAQFECPIELRQAFRHASDPNSINIQSISVQVSVSPAGGDSLSPCYQSFVASSLLLCALTCIIKDPAEQKSLESIFTVISEFQLACLWIKQEYWPLCPVSVKVEAVLLCWESKSGTCSIDLLNWIWWSWIASLEKEHKFQTHESIRTSLCL